MRVLFDQGTPVPLRHHLAGHENSALLDAAEWDGFEVLVTTDSHLKDQQNLASRRIAVVVLTSTSWPRIEQAIDAVVRATDGATTGSYPEVEIP